MKNFLESGGGKSTKKTFQNVEEESGFSLSKRGGGVRRKKRQLRGWGEEHYQNSSRGGATTARTAKRIMWVESTVGGVSQRKEHKWRRKKRKHTAGFN